MDENESVKEEVSEALDNTEIIVPSDTTPEEKDEIKEEFKEELTEWQKQLLNYQKQQMEISQQTLQAIQEMKPSQVTVTEVPKMEVSSTPTKQVENHQKNVEGDHPKTLTKRQQRLARKAQKR